MYHLMGRTVANTLQGVTAMALRVVQLIEMRVFI